MGKRGPAAKGEFGDKSAVLSTRISADLRAWLEKAKAESGLTLSREIEFRLRRTFTVDETIKESFGSRRNRALMKMLSMAMETTSRPDSSSERDWMDDPWLFDQVVRTLNNILRAIRPPGEAESPSSRCRTNWLAEPANTCRIRALSNCCFMRSGSQAS